MINELKFSNYVATGKYVQEIDLGEFIKRKYFYFQKVSPPLPHFFSLPSPSPSPSLITPATQATRLLLND